MNKILTYAPSNYEQYDSIYRLFDNLSFCPSLEIIQSFQKLTERLSQPQEDPTITVLIAPSKEDLAEILSIRNLLIPAKVILLLPDNDKDTINKGHSLCPHFLTFIDDDFKGVADVINKMLMGFNGDLNICTA